MGQGAGPAAGGAREEEGEQVRSNPSPSPTNSRSLAWLVARRDASAEVTKKKLLEIKKMRADIASMATQIREKEALTIKLKEEYDKMPKNINRTAYTYRIMDIIKQVRKQKTEIAKVETKLDGKQTMLSLADPACCPPPPACGLSTFSTDHW